MQSRINQVVDNFTTGYNCCQSIFAAYSDIYGIDWETALKLASGMGGGVGHTGRVCGFVSASCLLLGLKHGVPTPESQLEVFPICLKFCDDFAAKCGSITCKEIIKRDIRTIEATVKAQEEGVFKEICEYCGRFAAELLETEYGILNE